MSNSVLNSLKHRSAKVENKWAKGSRRALAVNEIEDTLLRQSTTLVLENIDTDSGTTLNPLIEEASTIGGFPSGTTGNLSGMGGLEGSNAAMYRPLSLALARRVYPSLFAHKLVGVQPMAAPVGMAFAMRNYYSETDATGKVTLGDTEAAWGNIPEYAGADTSITAVDISIKDGSTVIDATVTIADFKSSIVYTTVASNPSFTAAVPAVLAVPADGQNPAVDAAAAIPAQVKALDAGDLYSIQTSIEDGFTKGAKTSDAELLGVAGPDGTPAGGTGGAFAEIGIKWDQKTISATERPMAASFSLQSMTDIKALHEIDLKAEVMDTLQYESTAQLDRELLAGLKKTSIDTGKNAEGHDVKGGSVLKVNLDNSATGADADNRQMTAILVNAILFAANTVAKYTKRGKANFVVVSNKVATVLQAAVPFFTPVTTKIDAGIILSGSESTEIGNINGQLTVYIDQFAKVDYALVGYKGAGKVSDSGVIFSPYVMGLKHEAISESTFQPRIGVTSRYAITTGLIDAGAYYRSLVFTGLDSVIIGATPEATTNW